MRITVPVSAADLIGEAWSLLDEGEEGVAIRRIYDALKIAGREDSAAIEGPTLAVIPGEGNRANQDTADDASTEAEVASLPPIIAAHAKAATENSTGEAAAAS